LESIAKQTYPYFELLICDDCSTDDTGGICQEYVSRDSRFSYYRNASNIKMPSNLNSGLRRTHCEFVAICHDGDTYAPTTIEKWREALIKYPTAGFVFNRYRHLAPEGITGTITQPFPELMRGSDFLKFCLHDPNLEPPVWGTVMARRSIYEEMHFFDDHYSFWSDIDMWFRIAEKYDVAHVPEALIDLPHREVVPHLFDNNFFNWAAHRYMFKIYWNAKRRRYRDHRLKMIKECGEQAIGYPMVLGRRACCRLMKMIDQAEIRRRSLTSQQQQ